MNSVPFLFGTWLGLVNIYIPTVGCAAGGGGGGGCLGAGDPGQDSPQQSKQVSTRPHPGLQVRTNAQFSDSREIWILVSVSPLYRSG
jgi:hypothetical protein